MKTLPALIPVLVFQDRGRNFQYWDKLPPKCFCKSMKKNRLKTGMEMETGCGMEKTLELHRQIVPRLYEAGLEKDEAADILQNDINQTLAAVLLFLQSAMEDEQLAANRQLQLAEANLKDSVKKLVRMHYALLQD